MSWQDPDTMAETYYRTAYEHGEEAFARGESIEQCSEHYGPSEWWGMLGVEGWNNGWRDAFAASVHVTVGLPSRLDPQRPPGVAGNRTSWLGEAAATQDSNYPQWSRGQRG